MSIKEAAQRAHANLLNTTDPEALERINHFAFEEVNDEIDLPERTKMLSTLAYLLGMQGKEEYEVMLPVALDNGVSPVEAKEVLYQAVDYLGLGRVFPFFKITNEILTKRGVKLPLPGQATTNMDNRLTKGEETQMRLFGPGMKDFAKKGTINKWLVDNCFGDYYTRKGLDDQDREMITFCYLAAQGGVEPQLLAHAKANLALGNDAEFLKKIVLQNVPFIGYPRSLNAITVINEAMKNN
ncbi:MULTISPECIES: carboxymuconolactone decarboxylase family protein [Lactobacillus]|uniref:Carboxymuconolactone decarboxylase n=1 Tax=Lactobacillus xujianguonis TaxID=2495899 RepID=A0A437STE4_9LACO|nr:MULTISPECIES: carboxymuconolactone decarboxylase family protein [Lactobacillus]RVU70200.1 carboxymuconolactone decarboxylase [Lactobacillus xujianguonis]RVU76913.1 carboxymuconolactone decarboxylase [Lactobacillus xujianguonis]